jgi:hypothetical protein
MAGYGGNPWDSLTYATGNLGKNMTDLYSTLSARNIQQQQENRLAASSEIENKKNIYALNKAAEADAASKRIVDITAHPMFLSLPDEVKPKALDWFASQGVTDPQGRGQVGQIMEGVKQIEGSKQLFNEFMGPVLEQKKAGVIQAYGVYRDALAKGDQKKAGEALANFKKVSMEYQASAGKFSEHLTNLDKNEMELQKAGNKTPNEIELQIRANAGDPSAKAVLDKIQADKVRVAKESRPPAAPSYDKNILIAAQAAGIDPEKVKSGNLTQEEAIKVADSYSRRFGTQSLIQLLMSGGAGSSGTPSVKYDANGNPVK